MAYPQRVWRLPDCDWGDLINESGVEPYLTEHVSVAFEDVCRPWAARVH